MVGELHNINISKLSLYPDLLVISGILKGYHNKQHIIISEFIITRNYCIHSKVLK